MKTASEIKNAIADDLKDFGGHLECSVCGRTQSLGNIASNLSEGWPKCHGYTMTWITKNQALPNGRKEGEAELNKPTEEKK